MRDRSFSHHGGWLRWVTPGTVVIFFALAMTASVLGVVVWKALEAKSTALERGKTDIQNLAHSLAEHASHTIQAADIAMTGMVDLLMYQVPLPERFNKYLVETVATLPQIREIGVLNADGEWKYSSLPETPRHNNSDRNYFAYHRETPGKALRISEPLQSRLTGRTTIVLSKRITRMDGSFGGVLVAAIDSDYFSGFYRTFQIGQDGSVGLFRSDGIVLIRWPHSDNAKDLSKTDLFRTHLGLSSVGYYRVTSRLRRHREIYRIRESAAVSHGCHRGDVRGLAAFQLADDAAHRRDGCRRAVVHDHFAGPLLSSQFRFRMKSERALRDSEAHYRLLANNIADVVILMDAHGTLRLRLPFRRAGVGAARAGYCRQAVPGSGSSRGSRKPCWPQPHSLNGSNAANTCVFRTFRVDGSVVWLEINFKLGDKRTTRHRPSSSACFATSRNASGWRTS